MWLWLWLLLMLLLLLLLLCGCVGTCVRVWGLRLCVCLWVCFPNRWSSSFAAAAVAAAAKLLLCIQQRPPKHESKHSLVLARWAAHVVAPPDLVPGHLAVRARLHVLEREQLLLLDKKKKKKT